MDLERLVTYSKVLDVLHNNDGGPVWGLALCDECKID